MTTNRGPDFHYNFLSFLNIHQNQAQALLENGLRISENYYSFIYFPCRTEKQQTSLNLAAIRIITFFCSG